ncbi:MAG: histone deacetylase family protein [Alphaproteobacteria bacterium]|nr:histone deacetylase family protein [Alphaproteobacteria bacterium]
MSVLILTHAACVAHDPGPHHPECPDRWRTVIRALEAEAFSALPRAEAQRATREQILRVHPEAYLQAIMKAAPAEGDRVALDADTILSHGSIKAALRSAGAAVAAVDAVCTGPIRHAFCATRPPGHHAEPSRAMGFCVFANAAIAARHAQAVHGLTRVAVADFDVHHGNGTQACFEADASMMLASSHQRPLYPGTGTPQERGVGNIFNATLPPGADGAAFRAVWDRLLLPALDAFAPELLIISAGFDAHVADPLAQVRLTEADFAWITQELSTLAARHAEGRVVSVLEGGYDLAALGSSVAAHVRALMLS